MPAEPSPAHQPAARPDAAAQALRDAASAVAAAWDQPMNPDAYSRAVSQLYLSCPAFSGQGNCG